MKCATYMAIGAIAVPAGCATFLVLIFGPMFFADYVLGISPVWGLIFVGAEVGALLGALFCRSQQ